MTKALFILLIGFSSISNAQEIKFGETPKLQIGIGKFESDQILVSHFMDHVGWSDDTMFEESAYRMRDLLFKLVNKNPEARQWVKEVNQYFQTAEFMKQTIEKQEMDIFDAKIFAKMSIVHYGVLRDLPIRQY